MRARYGLLLVASATKAAVWFSWSQVIRLTTSSWPPNCSVTATIERLYGTLQVVEARAAVLSEALVAAEPGGERLVQRVALAAELAVELLAELELRRASPAALGAVLPFAASAQPMATAASTRTIGTITASRRRTVNPRNTIAGSTAPSLGNRRVETRLVSSTGVPRGG